MSVGWVALCLPCFTLTLTLTESPYLNLWKHSLPLQPNPLPKWGQPGLTFLTALLVWIPMLGTHAKYRWLGAEDWLA